MEIRNDLPLPSRQSRVIFPVLLYGLQEDKARPNPTHTFRPKSRKTHTDFCIQEIISKLFNESHIVIK
jgi:hypothetical protein